MKDLNGLFNNYCLSVGIEISLINLSDEEKTRVDNCRTIFSKFFSDYYFGKFQFHCEPVLVNYLLTILEPELFDCNDNYNNNSVVTSSFVKIKTSENANKEGLLNSFVSLEDTNSILKAENESNNRFISSMNHELKVPLNAVKGFNDQ